MKTINYYVIGGQYQDYNHGGAETLLGAKRLAARNEEHWDNWQGWHCPAVYAAQDCCEQTNFYGEQMLPRDNAQPVAAWDERQQKWVDPKEEMWGC